MEDTFVEHLEPVVGFTFEPFNNAHGAHIRPGRIEGGDGVFKKFGGPQVVVIVHGHVG